MMGEDDNGRIGRLIRSQYVGWLDSIIDSNLGSESYKTYSVMHQQTASRPFGSVLVRTQGKRDEGLRETLLCLAAQSLQDFEVLILAHKVTEAGSCVIEKAISDQEEWFRSRIRRSSWAKSFPPSARS